MNVSNPKKPYAVGSIEIPGGKIRELSISADGSLYLLVTISMVLE